MHKSTVVAAWAWALCAVCTNASAQAAPCVKSLRWVDAAPYSFKDPHGEIRGLHIDVAREALRRMGCQTRLVEMPWSRALVELQLGRLDLLPGAANTRERLAFAYFTRPTNRARSVLFVTRKVEDKYKLTQLADIMGTDFRLAVQRNTSLGTEYDALMKNPAFLSRLTYVYSQKSALLMMAAGRAEGMVVDELAGMQTIRQLGLAPVLTRSKVVTSTDADYIAISKASNDADFVRRFNNALISMQGDGSYKKILEQYLNCPISVEKLGCQ